MRNYLFFLAGQLGLMIQVRYFFQWIVDFSSITSIGLSVATVGALLFSFRIFDAVTDPLAGVLSDFLYSKGRSRAEFLGYSAVLMSLGLYTSFLPGPLHSAYINFIIFFIGFFIFFSGYTLYCIPYWSLIEEFGQGNPERKVKLSALIGQGLFLATAIGFIGAPLIVQMLGYRYGALCSILVGLPLMILPKFCKFDTLNSSKLETRLEKIGFKDFFNVFRSREFISVLILLIGSQMAFTILTSLSPLFVVNVLKKEISYLAFIMGPVIISAVICFLFVPKLRTRFKEKNLVRNFSIFLGILFILAAFVSSYFGTTGAIIVFALMGPCLAVILGLESYLINESSSSEDRVGVTFGAFNFAVKSMNGLALLFSSLVVSRLKESQDSGVVLVAIAVGGVVVLVLTGISIYIDSKGKALVSE